MVIKYQFLKTCGNNLKSWASIFQLQSISILAICSQRHLLAVSAYWLDIAIVYKNSPLFVGLLQHKFIFWLFKDMLKVCENTFYIWKHGAYLKGLGHEDFAVLSQFWAKIVT